MTGDAIVLNISGRKFDNAGEMIRNDTGWSKLSIKHFKEKAECLVKQFGQYKVLNKFHVRNFLNILSLCLSCITVE